MPQGLSIWESSKLDGLLDRKPEVEVMERIKTAHALWRMGKLFTKKIMWSL